MRGARSRNALGDGDIDNIGHSLPDNGPLVEVVVDVVMHWRGHSQAGAEPEKEGGRTHRGDGCDVLGESEPVERVKMAALLNGGRFDSIEEQKNRKRLNVRECSVVEGRVTQGTKRANLKT